ncbi:hypothetical protein AQI88_15400, partial [Streptomyces cellostaticus]
MAVLTVAVVAAVVLAVVFTRFGGGGTAKGGEVFLQSAANKGPDPYTDSTVKEGSVPQGTSPTPGASSGAISQVQGVDGGTPGLYGGTQKTSSCDVEKQIKALQADPAKSGAFATVAGVRASGVPAYLRSLTSVQLRSDTRVTNHGYRDGAPTSYQAVLQAGTAVLVDGHGVPRVRCACGNPLTPPVAQHIALQPTGDHWASYQPSKLVVVVPAPIVVKVFVVYDTHRDDWFHRHTGDTGRHDQHVQPPQAPWQPSEPHKPGKPHDHEQQQKPGEPQNPQKPQNPQNPGKHDHEQQQNQQNQHQQNQQNQ